MRQLALAGAVAILPVALFACDSGGTECTCSFTGLSIRIPAPLAFPPPSFDLGGDACRGATPSCLSGTPRACTAYHVPLVAAGACDLTISLANGTVYQDTLAVVDTPGCCAGLRTDPPAAAMVDVPAPFDGGIDAGVVGADGADVQMGFGP